MKTEIKKWIDENPLDAENQEDLATWAAEMFDVDDDTEDEIWDYVRRTSYLPR